ncbi:MAG TPA: hypothetical protein VF210_06360 [Pseudomonadales bacterium]|jgi:hypothetical protein
MKIDPLCAAAFTASLVVWLLVSAADGGGEAWDSGVYWSVGLPIIYGLGAVFGLVSTVNVWRLALWSGIGQFTGLVLTAPGEPTLWPLGLVMMGVLSLPVAGLAQLGRALRNRLVT